MAVAFTVSPALGTDWNVIGSAQNELRLGEAVRLEATILDGVVALVAVRGEGPEIGGHADFLHGHAGDGEGARDVAGAPRRPSARSPRPRTAPDAVSDEGSVDRRDRRVYVPSRAPPSATGVSLDRHPGLGIALEEEVPARERQGDQHDDRRRPPRSGSCRAASSATSVLGWLDATDVYGQVASEVATTLSADGATPRPRSSKHHSLASAGRPAFALDRPLRWAVFRCQEGPGRDRDPPNRDHRRRRHRPRGRRRGAQGRRRARGRLRRRSRSTSAARATCAPATCCPTTSSPPSAASTPSCSARSARPTCRPACSNEACSCGFASSSTSTSTSGRSMPGPSALNQGLDLRVDAREHRGRLRG